MEDIVQEAGKTIHLATCRCHICTILQGKDNKITKIDKSLDFKLNDFFRDNLKFRVCGCDYPPVTRNH